MTQPPPGADRLLAALRNLPEFRGIVFRGASVSPPDEQVLSAPLPTSTDPRIATENFSRPIVVAILTSTGRLIGGRSRTPEENEVVLLPGTVIRVAARSASGDLVVLEEVQDGELDTRIDQVLAELTVTLEVSRASDAVAVPSPGKFAD